MKIGEMDELRLMLIAINGSSNALERHKEPLEIMIKGFECICRRF